MRVEVAGGQVTSPFIALAISGEPVFISEEIALSPPPTTYNMVCAVAPEKGDAANKGEIYRVAF